MIRSYRESAGRRGADPCCCLAHEAPHYPYQRPRDDAFRTVGMKTTQGRGPREDKPRACTEMITALDQGVGEVMQALRDQDLEAQTLVIFCSDNGATRVGSNGELNNFKGTLKERKDLSVCQGTGRPKSTAGNSDHQINTVKYLP